MYIPKLRGPNYNDYIPPAVPSWADLDDRIDAFIEENTHAASTRKSHVAGWKSWEDFCKEVRVGPLNAPYEAFAGLLTRVREEDGHVLAGGTFDNIIAAINARYATEGLTPAHALPQNAADFKALRRSARTKGNHRKRAHPESHAQWVVAPLLIDHLEPMVTTPLPTSEQHDARLAGLLLAWDGQLGAPDLARLQVTDVASDGTQIRIGDSVFLCDHRERARGVPWDCTRCAVLAVLEHHPGDGPLLAAATDGDLYSYFAGCLGKLRRLSWRGAGMDVTSSKARVAGQVGKPSALLTPDQRLNDYQLAGMRRASALMMRGRTNDGLRWLRARAWVATAWTSGFRMCGDLLRLERDAVITVERGVMIRLAGTKDDPFGSKRVTRCPEWSKTERPGATEYLAEYLAVRDALHGLNGALFTTTATPKAGVDHSAPHIADGGEGVGGGTGVAKSDLALLTDLAGGLDGAVYSSKSVRMGFATQLHDAGWEPEAIKDFLRHTTLDPVLRSYIQGLGPKASADRLMTSLEKRPA